MRGWLCLLFVLIPPAQADSLLDTNDLHHIQRALDCLNMTRADLGFDKDHGEHAFSFDIALQILGRPLDLPVFGKRILDDARQFDAESFCKKISQRFEGTSRKETSPQQRRNIVNPPLRGIQGTDPARIRHTPEIPLLEKPIRAFCRSIPFHAPGDLEQARPQLHSQTP